MQIRKIQADRFDNARLHQSGAGDQEYAREKCFHFVSHLSGGQASSVTDFRSVYHKPPKERYPAFDTTARPYR
jgi:hypothetical protein